MGNFQCSFNVEAGGLLVYTWHCVLKGQRTQEPEAILNSKQKENSKLKVSVAPYLRKYIKGKN